MDPFFMLMAVPLAVGIYLVASTGCHARWRIVRNLAGFFLVALPSGGLAYFFSGIWIARSRGVGHFFSIPFGGYAVSDSAVLGSVACWIGLIFALMTIAFRHRLKRVD